MKKQTFRIRLLVILFLASFVFFACEQEDMNSTNESPKENKINEKTIHRFRGQSKEKIREAQKWVSEHTIQTRSSEESILGWEYAFSDSTKTYETVEVPVGYLKQKCIVLSDCEEKYNETKDAKYLQNITRLVIETNKETEEKRSYYMTIVPSAKCIEQAADSLSLNTYLQRNKSFDGCILFFDLDKQLINGWQYESGKITEVLTPSSKVQTRAVETVCQTTYEVTTTEWYSNGRHTSTTVRVDSYETCWQRASFSEFPVTGADSSGGNGGGAAGSNTTDANKAKKDKKQKKQEKTPCSQAKRVGKNPQTKELMKKLQGKVSDNKEHGYLLKQIGFGVEATHIEGVENAGEINFTFNEPIDGYIHSHYTGTLSIFSPSDIFAIVQIYKQGKILDVNSFVAGVVTSQNTQYLLVIDNLEQFENFADRIWKNGKLSNSEMDKEEIMFNAYGIKPTNAPNKNEVSFLRFMANRQYGLKLLKMDKQIKKWNLIELQNNKITKSNCDN